MKNKAISTIKKNMLKMTHYSKASHIGAALSVVDVLFVIYSKIADITPDNVKENNRDKVILSKGHASIALYAVLAEMGLLAKEKLDQYYIDGGVLPGHLDKDSEDGVDCSSGSLGHGLSIATGMALANPNKKIFVILGDGEINEGSVWEGFLLLGTLKLKNLIVIIDNNNLQGFGRTSEIADYSKLSSTLINFGLRAVDVDGHNLEQLENVLKKPCGETKVVITHTVKGNGISFMENELKWHYKSPNDEELEIALRELDE